MKSCLDISRSPCKQKSTPIKSQNSIYVNIVSRRLFRFFVEFYEPQNAVLFTSEIDINMVYAENRSQKYSRDRRTAQYKNGTATKRYRYIN